MKPWLPYEKPSQKKFVAFCNYTHKSFGGCQQNAAIEHWCEFHYRFLVVMKQEPADDYYHRKVLSRKLTPTWPDMTSL